jgi:hypothetical protein
MESNSMFKTFLLTVVLAVAFMTAWELYVRSRGFSPTYNDDKILWATKRGQVYQSPDQCTVFIGPSRIKFDLDIPLWKHLTGEDAIQLAMVGTSPRPLLRDLANDENFKGKLIVDAMETAVFSPATFITEKSAVDGLAYYQGETLAQRGSAMLGHQLESQLAFLEEGKFGISNLLNDLQLPSRPGIFTFPSMPHEFAVSSYDRQTSMTPMFLTNPALIKRQTDCWIRLGALNKAPGIKGDTLERVFKEMKDAVDKIRARGGKVVFLRMPSSGTYLESETVAYPRDQYWEPLLKYTNTPGIHYADYPAIANFTCPEWSHLQPKDVITFTNELVRILRDEHGWDFVEKATAYK